MKTLYITVGQEAPVPRYFLRSGLLQKICDKGNIKIILLVVKSQEDLYRKEFGGANISIVGINISNSKKYEALISFSRMAFRARLSKLVHWQEYRLLGASLSKVLSAAF